MIDIVGNILLGMAEEEKKRITPQQREAEARSRREWEAAERRREKERRNRLINAIPTDSLRANKTNFRKVVRWSSSRYNTMKKAEVVEALMRHYLEGVNGIYTYSCGSYTQSSDMSRAGTYHLVIESPEGAKLIVEDGPVYRLIR